MIKNYNIGDGLIQSTVRAICQDSTGYLWFGTNKGLSRFDGKNFKNFTEPEELFSYKIREIVQLCNYELLILNFNNELWKFDGNHFFRYQPLQDQNVKVTDILVVGNDSLLLGTRANGVYLVTPNETLNYNTKNGLYSNRIIELSTDKRKNINCLTAGGVSILKDGIMNPMFKNDKFEICGFLQNSDGTYWCTGKGKGFFRFIGGKWESFSSETNFGYSSFQESGNKSIWASTTWGLFQIIVNSVGEIYTFQPIPAFYAYNVFVDKNDNIWCGTLGRGIYKVSKNPFFNITNRNGFPSFYGKTLLKDKNEDIWISAYESGLVKANSFGSKSFFIKDGLPNNFVHCATNYLENKILFGTRNGITQFDNNKFSNFSDTGLPSKLITDIVFTADSNLFVSIYKKGLFQYKENKWHPYLIDGISGKSHITTLYQDNKNILWIGTLENGLFKLKNNRMTNFSSKNGLVSNKINTLRNDHLGNLWIGTDKGINLLKDDQIETTYTTSDGLQSTSIFALESYKDKMIIGSDDGLGIYSDGKFQFLNTSDGISTNHINGPKIIADKFGKIWIGNTDGMSIFLIENYLKNNKNFNLVLSSIISNQDTLTNTNLSPTNFSQNLDFEAGLDFINFNFSSITFSDKVFRYRYKIKQNEIISDFIYSDIPQIKLEECSYGFYEIEFEAKAFGNNWDKVDKISFTIQPHFYQTSIFWFIFSLIIIGAGITTRILLLKNKEKKKYNTSSLTKEKTEKIKNDLLSILEKDQKFKDPTISLLKLSVKLDSSKEHISQVINAEFKCNFNELINSYRIKEAKHLLDQNGKLNLQVIQIAYEVGFNSKSSFNNAFKKFAGMTPTEYKKQIRH